MARRCGTPRRLILLWGVLGLLIAPTAAQAETVWTLRPAQQGRDILFAGLTRTAYPQPVLEVPVVAEIQRSQWILRRVGNYQGSIRAPVYAIQNRAVPGCLWGNRHAETATMAAAVCTAKPPWALWVFRGQRGFVGDPFSALSQGTVWNISTLGDPGGHDERLCLTVYGLYNGARLRYMPCRPEQPPYSVVQQFRLYKGTVP